MLKELRLSNFRLFGDEVVLRFRPITVMIGRNNSGKSSIIKFLLMLKQSLGSGSEYLDSHGSIVELGKFSQLQNKTKGNGNLQFCLSLGDNESPPDAVRRHLENKKLDYANDERTYEAKASVQYGSPGELVGKNQEVSLLVAGKSIVKIKENISPNSSLFGFSSEVSRLKPEEQEVAKYAIELFRYDISELRYLSENKRKLPRFIDTEQKFPHRSVGITGKYTLHQLVEILRDSRKKGFLLKHTKKTLDIKNITCEPSDGVARPRAMNAKLNIDHHIADFGFGVSQCMPIFIQGLLMNPRTNLIVSQPESHVHPTAQLELGSFFADLWKIWRVHSIIETHSDNILLRLRRLIANEKLDSDDVSVAFFDTDKSGKATITNLEIDKHGSMEPGLPMEFFGANILEALELGAGD